jgi:pyrimidine operon attenuation protein/uracil phosphoribosyltransferase
MSAQQTPVLNHQSILTKLERMACEICEEHMESSRIVLCGMNSRGFFIATALAQKVKSILPELMVDLVQVDTTSNAEVAFLPPMNLEACHIIVVDDVINTGKTLMHVLQNIFNQNPETIKTAFLAKREHRNYPVKADFVGISLATTLQEHVVFDNNDPNALRVYLN